MRFWQQSENFFFLGAEAGENAAFEGQQLFWRLHPLLQRALQHRIKHVEAIEEHLKLQHY
ncbi:MAG TPA: hypothetical protein VGB77_14550 [Abditibacteriaceae bacterium]|jgi:hypothetical protein